MPRSLLGVLVLALLAVACAPESAPPDAAMDDARTISCEATDLEIREACGFPTMWATDCSPDGEGWCCPFAIPPASSCGCHPGGGFVRSPCGCSLSLCDWAPSAWGERIDEHGCHVAEMRSMESCLLPPVDAGTDAPAIDAGTDAPAIDASPDAGP